MNDSTSEASTGPTPILVCGLLAADLVFSVDTLPTEAIKYRADKVAMICGGGGTYAALAIKRLGGNAELFARLGDDFFGKFILSSLQDEGIHCEHVIIEAATQTSVSGIALAQGERQIVNYRDHRSSAYTGELRFDPAPRAVLVDTRWLGGSLYSLAYAAEHNIPGIIDAEAPVSQAAMQLASHIAFSRQGLSDFAGTDSILAGLQQAAAQFSAWVCVTDGANGTHVLQGSQLKTVPAPAIKAIDTLGAGDVWHGAFSLQMAQGADELSAVRFANVAAALKCSRSAERFPAPELNEVLGFMNAEFASV